MQWARISKVPSCISIIGICGGKSRVVVIHLGLHSITNSNPDQISRVFVPHDRDVVHIIPISSVVVFLMRPNMTRRELTPNSRVVVAMVITDRQPSIALAFNVFWRSVHVSPQN